MSAPLRILCLNYEYPPVGGGGGRIAHRINAGLVARGHAVRVQTAGLRHLAAHETVDGVEIFRAESFRRREDTCTVPEMALFLATALRPTLRQIRAWRPHVIHAHFAVPTGALAWAASLLTRTPYLLTAHLGDVPGGVPEQTAGLFRLIGPLARPIWKRAAALTAVSTFVADLAERAYGRRPEVIFNGVSLGPRPAIVPHTPPRLLMVGRLSVQKNPRLALRALALLRDVPWEFHVIGDGPLRPEMELAARTLGLDDRVRFRGWLEGDAVAREMAAGDVLLMTSLSEGLPMAALEALDHCLAIVSSHIGGVTDVVVEGKTGALCSLAPESFAAALRLLLTDFAQLLRWREAGSRHALRFELAASIDRYETALRRVAGLRSGQIKTPRG